MKQKPSRWYEVIEGTAYIYDQPYTSRARSVSIVSADQLAYYRANFKLSKVWGVTCE